jgi:hypothetical protein
MPDLWTQVVPFVVVVLFLIWTISYGRRRSARVKRAEAVFSQDEQDNRSRLQRSMEQLQVNIMEFGRDVEARIDTKIATLSRLILDADERISRLEKLRGHSSRANGVPPLHAEVYRLADEGLERVEIARQTAMTPGEIDLVLGLRGKRDGG